MGIFGHALPAYCNLYSFETDKTLYYLDETIEINATYDLYYNISTEISYVQVQIYDDLNDLLWNSSEYHALGTHQITFAVNIEDLEIHFFEDNLSLFIKFYYYFEAPPTLGSGIVKDTLEVIIQDNQPYCRIFAFNTEKETYHENETLEITAYWDLCYNPNEEIFYGQIQLYDETSSLLWNSTKLPERGVHFTSWYIPVQNLSIELDNETINLNVKFYYFYDDFTFFFQGILEEFPVYITDIVTSSGEDSPNEENPDNSIPDLTISFELYYLIPLGAASLLLVVLNKKRI